MMRPEWCNATVVMYGTIVPACPSMTRTLTGTVKAALNNNLNKNRTGNTDQVYFLYFYQIPSLLFSCQFP